MPDESRNALPGGPPQPPFRLPRNHPGIEARVACPFMKSSGNSLTRVACSCGTQCPAPSSRWQPTKQIHARVLYAIDRSRSLIDAPVALARDEDRRHVLVHPDKLTI